jgi:hypothetical protein
MTYSQAKFIRKDLEGVLPQPRANITRDETKLLAVAYIQDALQEFLFPGVGQGAEMDAEIQQEGILLFIGRGPRRGSLVRCRTGRGRGW